MPYRWNLDYVVDPHGNSMTYFYEKYVGKYGLANNSETNTYDIGAWLNRVEYGTRAGSEAAQAVPARVVFSDVPRCYGPNCSTWPDVPWDQFCFADSCPHLKSPSFWVPHRMSASAGVVVAVTVAVRHADVCRYMDVTSSSRRPGAR